MQERIDRSRRRLLGSAVMTLAGMKCGLFGGGAEAAASRELAAITEASEWINSPRPTMSEFAGKVVLVDFCTYTCINWLRTLPYRRAWAKKYMPGLVLIGVHTPEFGFEKTVDNVRRAVERLGIEYPVVIDNEYAIWRAFENHYWPALYFIDARGRVRQHHFGEGEYEQSERSMQRLLAQAGPGRAPDGLVSVAGIGVEMAADWGNLKSPETYLGYGRAERFVSPGGTKRDQRREYAAPARVSLNHWALAGGWTIGREASVLSTPSGRIVCRFHSRDLHLVMGPARGGSPVRFRVTLDGQSPGPAHGGDVDQNGNGVAVEQRLYQLVRQGGPIVERRFEIEFLDAGVETFAFTFG